MEKLDLLGVTSALTVHSAEYLRRLLEACRPHKTLPAAQAHLRTAGYLATRLSGASVVTDPAMFDNAIKGKWLPEGAKGALSLRHFYHGGAAAFSVDMTSIASSASFRIHTGDALKGVGDWLGAVAGEEYVGVCNPIIEHLGSPENPCHSVKDLMLFDVANSACSSCFNDLRTLNLRHDPGWGPRKVVPFMEERMRLAVAELKKIASPAGAVMEAYFYSHVLKRMEWGSRGPAKDPPGGTTTTSTVPKPLKTGGASPKVAPTLCANHLRFLLKVTVGTKIAGPCERANCEYLHFNKRFVQVTKEELTKMIRASGMREDLKSGLCSDVEQSKLRFKQ
jgi:hypothetical protein